MACHAGMSGADWTIAGTLYSGASSTSPVAGATIRVTDANGSMFDLITATNGNFYTTRAVAFPVKVAATLCPSNVPMEATVSDGSCNSCHTSAFRIHLP